MPWKVWLDQIKKDPQKYREFRDRVNAQRRERYATDPKYRKRRLELANDWKKRNPERRKLWLIAHKERLSKYHREYLRQWQPNYIQRLRSKILDMLGRKCIYCGCDNERLLEINHKKIETENTRRKSKDARQYYLRILRGDIPLEELETVCTVCNIWHFCQEKYGNTGHKILWNPPIISHSEV